MQTQYPLIIDTRQVSELTGIKYSSLVAMRTDGRFGPRELPISGKRHYRYNRSEIEAWIEAGCPARTEWVKK